MSPTGQPNRPADGIPGGGKLKPEGPVRIPVQRQPGDAEERRRAEDHPQGHPTPAEGAEARGARTSTKVAPGLHRRILLELPPQHGNQ